MTEIYELKRVSDLCGFSQDHLREVIRKEQIPVTLGYAGTPFLKSNDVLKLFKLSEGANNVIKN